MQYRLDATKSLFEQALMAPICRPSPSELDRSSTYVGTELEFLYGCNGVKAVPFDSAGLSNSFSAEFEHGVNIC